MTPERKATIRSMLNNHRGLDAEDYRGLALELLAALDSAAGRVRYLEVAQVGTNATHRAVLARVEAVAERLRSASIACHWSANHPDLWDGVSPRGEKALASPGNTLYK